MLGDCPPSFVELLVDRSSAARLNSALPNGDCRDGSGRPRMHSADGDITVTETATAPRLTTRPLAADVQDQHTSRGRSSAVRRRPLAVRTRCETNTKGLTIVEWRADARYRQPRQLLLAHPLPQELAEVWRDAVAAAELFEVVLLEDRHAMARAAEHVRDREAADACRRERRRQVCQLEGARA